MGNLFLSGFRFKSQKICTTDLAGERIDIQFHPIFPKWNCDYESWHNTEVYRLQIPFSFDILEKSIQRKMWIELHIILTVYENEKQYKINLDENWYRLFNDEVELNENLDGRLKSMLDNMKKQFKDNIEPVFLNELALIENKMSVVNELC